MQGSLAHYGGPARTHQLAAPVPRCAHVTPPGRRPRTRRRYTENPVDAWLNLLHRVPADSLLHQQLEELLTSQPEVLHTDPQRVCAIVNTLLHATVKQRLYNNWSYPPDVVLSLAAHWTPEQLQSALDSLQPVVSVAFGGLADVSDLLAACAPHVEPLLLLDKRDLIRKADLVSKLIPEFTPATVMRACPEVLLNWHTAELREGICRAGDVVVVGRGLAAELLTATPATHQPQPAAAAAADSQPQAAFAPPPHTQLQLHSHTAQQNTNVVSSSVGADPAATATAAAAAGGGGGGFRRRWSAESTAQRLLPGSCVRITCCGPAPAPRTPHTALSSLPHTDTCDCNDLTLPQQQLTAERQDTCPADNLDSPTLSSSSSKGPSQRVDMFPRTRGSKRASVSASQFDRTADEELCVVVNTRMLLFVNNGLVEVRFNDPWRQEQEFRSHGGHCSGGQGFTPRSWMVWPGKTSPPAIVGGSGGRSHRSSHRTHP